MPAAIGATAIAWIARVLSGRLVADRGDGSDSGDYMRTSLNEANRPFAGKPSRDLLFIKLSAIALKMPEMEKACREYQNGQI